MVAVLVVMGLVVWGLSRLSQVTVLPEQLPVLRVWLLPERASASSAAESCRLAPSPERVPCAAALAIDGDPETAWCEGVAGDGVGERLTVYLAEPAMIEAVRLKAGYQKDAERFEQNRAPTAATLLVGGTSQRLELVAEQAVFSELRLAEPVMSDSITLVIEATTEAPFAVTCISEMELQVQR
jgi:hypothetical protein